MADGGKVTGVRLTALMDNAGPAAGSGLRSQWGLSFWIETPAARLLLDCGATGRFLANARSLEVDPADADAFVLSHGHFDHGGGLPEVVRHVRPRRLVLHPAALAPRYSLSRTGKVESSGLQERSLAAVRERPEQVDWAVAPVRLAPGAWASGPIPRRHPLEEAEPHFRLDPACTIRDHVVDDQAVWLETPRGLVIVSGCAHAGIINTVDYVRRVVAERETGGHEESPALPRDADGLPSVRAVLGGFHLLQARKDRLAATADYLEGLHLELCAPCHCTGKRATDLLRERLPNAFGAVRTGAVLTLS